jgi:hypothetical protein
MCYLVKERLSERLTNLNVFQIAAFIEEVFGCDQLKDEVLCTFLIEKIHSMDKDFGENEKKRTKQICLHVIEEMHEKFIEKIITNYSNNGD